MKITISPSESEMVERQAGSSILSFPCSITIDLDDGGFATADEAMAMCAKALVAYGYHQNNIRETLAEEIALEIFGKKVD